MRLDVTRPFSGTPACGPACARRRRSGADGPSRWGTAYWHTESPRQPHAEVQAPRDARCPARLVRSPVAVTGGLYGMRPRPLTLIACASRCRRLAADARAAREASISWPAAAELTCRPGAVAVSILLIAENVSRESARCRGAQRGGMRVRGRRSCPGKAILGRINAVWLAWMAGGMRLESACMDEFDERIRRLPRERETAARLVADRAKQELAARLETEARDNERAREAQRFGREFAIRARQAHLPLVTVHVIVGIKKGRKLSEKRQVWDVGEFDDVSPYLRDRGWVSRHLFVGEDGEILLGHRGRIRQGSKDPGRKDLGPHGGGVERVRAVGAKELNLMASAFV
jgi:hypothetical protein